MYSFRDLQKHMRMSLSRLCYRARSAGEETFFGFRLLPTHTPGGGTVNFGVTCMPVSTGMLPLFVGTPRNQGFLYGSLDVSGV